MLTELEKKIIAAVQGDIPITRNPYQEIASRIGIDESTLLETLQRLSDQGVMRRFGATLRHQKTGYSANAMVAWQVDEEQIDDAGKTLAGFKEVSHCYHRPPAADWPYNLYTMIHASDEDSCRKIAHRMSQTIDVATYKILFSRRELKKTSMQYFPQNA